ncbi:hypothetical protein WA026_004327 [Henosepilachna vigintioctopunctata]
MATKGILPSASQPPWRRAYAPVLVVSIVLLASPVVSPQNTDGEFRDKNGICKSVDIRNSLETFQRLRGCRVVEGFVRILLFDNVNETSLSKIQFPELMEITDYLLMYRVNGLRSIGQLFPNLTVIRGQNSFFRYSLIVFEMSSLQEIALYSLSNITKGYIRIDKNPSLCFIKSIDWDKIVTGGDVDQNYINVLKPENECPICPGEEAPKDESGVQTCPIAPYKSKAAEFNRKRHLCWNRLHCQKICPKGCSACNSRGECCHPNCLGGCALDDVNNCSVCSKFEVWDGSVRKCLDSCPNGTLEFLGRRCVSAQECRNMSRPIYLPSSEPFHPYNIHLNKCVLRCPVNMNVEQQTCVPCMDGRCRKSCNGVSIDSIEIAKQLTGCTRITGSLEIQIRGGSNVVNELEESLSMIEEIDGYLKVVRSFPLVSLNFMKSLRHIRGNSLESQKFAVVVLDNQNLQDLWEWKDNRTLKIDHGRLFFHFNPKLCLDKIRILENKTGLSPPFTELEVANSSNGDKIACDVTDLAVKVKNIESKAVSLAWQPFQLDDQRNLLGYIVYSIQAKYRNLTMYDGRDACGGDGWRVDDVTVPEDHNQEVVHLLTQLTPYTHYAFYVKTYTIAKENNGAQSKIQYFRTAPAVPSPPLKVTVTSDSSDSLRITWVPPKNPNGNVTNYLIVGKKRHTSDNGMNSRNHCDESMIMPIQMTSSEPPPRVDLATPVNNGTCSCDDRAAKEPSINEDIQVERIKFENALHNEVYIRKEPIENRKRRALHNTFPTKKKTSHNSDNQRIGNTTENGTDIWESFQRTVYGRTELWINKLHHFTYYDISVQACREREGPSDMNDLCSFQSVESGRTFVKVGADNIKRVYMVNQTLETVTIRWDDLPDPNGMIFKYFIEYKRNAENSKPSSDCITHQEWITQGKTYTLKLSPGNYSLRVLASTAGNNGKYSPPLVFLIRESNGATVLVLSIVMPIFVMGFLALFLCYKKQQNLQKGSLRLVPVVNPEYMSTDYTPDEWEISRNHVNMKAELGQGSFGMVYEGLVYDVKEKAHMKCAIKTVNEHSTDR